MSVCYYNNKKVCVEHKYSYIIVYTKLMVQILSAEKAKIQYRHDRFK